MFLFLNTCGDITDRTLSEDEVRRFGVSYSDFDVETANGYKLLVTEPYYSDKEELLRIRNEGIKTLAYISLGEVHPSRSYYSKFKESGLRGKNPDQESFYIDLKSKIVKEVFLKEIIPQYLSKGFNGLFLDTIDAVSPYSDRRDQQAEMIDLILSIRNQYPDITIIQNAGFFLLSETSSAIDAVVIEGVASGYDFQTKKYSIASREIFQQRMALVDSLTARFNKPLIIIDFAESSETRKHIQSLLSDYNFPYFISNISFKGLPVISKTGTEN